MDKGRWQVERWTQPAMIGDRIEIVECARVYPLETLIRGPVAEAGTIFDNGRQLGWLAWEVDRYGQRVRNGKLRPTLEQAFDTLDMEVEDART